MIKKIFLLVLISIICSGYSTKPKGRYNWAKPPCINLDTIREISNGPNKNPYNITEKQLEKYNKYNINQLLLSDMKDPINGMLVTDWYFTVYIPALLKFYNIPYEIDIMLMVFKWGPKNTIEYMAGLGGIPSVNSIRFMNEYLRLEGIKLC